MDWVDTPWLRIFFFTERSFEERSGLSFPGSVNEKKVPGFRGVENRGADGFAIPSGCFPFRLDVQYRYARIIG